MNATSPIEQIDSLKYWLRNCLIGKNETIDTLLTAMIAGEHVYYIGPPGTGKTLMATLLSKALNQSTKEIQFSRRTSEDEVFGPLDIKALVPDEGPSRYVRVKNPNVTYAQDADVLILDEPANASPSILKGFHALLQERKYHDGEQWHVSPLRVCIGTSNEELPEECFALRDRFAVKKVEGYLTGPEAKTMRSYHLNGRLKGYWDAPPTITQGCFDAAKDMAQATPFSKNAVNAFTRILVDADAAGVTISDRTQLKAMDVLKAYAFYMGAEIVCKTHLMFAQHLLWDELTDRETIHKIVEEVAGEDARKIQEMTAIIDGWFDESAVRCIERQANNYRSGTMETWEYIVSEMCQNEYQYNRVDAIARCINIIKEAKAVGKVLTTEVDCPQDIIEGLRAKLQGLCNNLSSCGVNLSEAL